MFATLLDLFHEGSWLATEHWSQRQEIAVENANRRDYRYFSVFGGWHDARLLRRVMKARPQARRHLQFLDASDRETSDMVNKVGTIN